MPRSSASHHRVLAALTAGGVLVLTACSGMGDATVGEPADVTISYSGQKLPFTVEVGSFDPAPDDVQAGMEGDETLYYADVSFTYTGDADASLPPVYSQVYSALEDGTFLETTFMGLTECTGSPEDAPGWLADLAAGETVSVCVPLSEDADNPAVGVYVGSSDVNEGGVVFRP